MDLMLRSPRMPICDCTRCQIYHGNRFPMNAEGCACPEQPTRRSELLRSTLIRDPTPTFRWGTSQVPCAGDH